MLSNFVGMFGQHLFTLLLWSIHQNLANSLLFPKMCGLSYKVFTGKKLNMILWHMVILHTCLTACQRVKIFIGLEPSDTQSPKDGPVVYPANAFYSRLRGYWVPLGSSPTKILKITTPSSPYFSNKTLWSSSEVKLHLGRRTKRQLKLAYTTTGETLGAVVRMGPIRNVYDQLESLCRRPTVVTQAVKFIQNLRPFCSRKFLTPGANYVTVGVFAQSTQDFFAVLYHLFDYAPVWILPSDLHVALLTADLHIALLTGDSYHSTYYVASSVQYTYREQAWTSK